MTSNHYIITNGIKFDVNIFRPVVLVIALNEICSQQLLSKISLSLALTLIIWEDKEKEYKTDIEINAKLTIISTGIE